MPNPTFPATYPGAIVAPAHPSRYYGDGPLSPIPAGGRRDLVIRAICYHTPEEPADATESTPVYFATPCANPTTCGGTRYYIDSDGDVYQMVPDEFGAIANGLNGKPAPYWAAGYSLNLQTENAEIEGYAHSLQRTMTNAQWIALTDWSVWTFLVRGIPREPGRMVGHYELSVDRTDPGPWLLSAASGFRQEVLQRVLNIERDILEIKKLVADGALRLNAFEALMASILPPLAAGHTGVAQERLRYVYTAAGRPYPYP